MHPCLLSAHNGVWHKRSKVNSIQAMGCSPVETRKTKQIYFIAPKETNKKTQTHTFTHKTYQYHTNVTMTNKGKLTLCIIYLSRFGAHYQE